MGKFAVTFRQARTSVFQTPNDLRILIEPMIKKTTLLLLLFLPFLYCSAQENFTLSGTLKDAATGDDIIGARITVVEHHVKGAITNTYGFYSLTIPKGSYTIEYKSMGFVIQQVKIDLTANLTKNLEMVPESKMIDAVTVTTEK